MARIVLATLSPSGSTSRTTGLEDEAFALRAAAVGEQVRAEEGPRLAADSLEGLV